MSLGYILVTPNCELFFAIACPTFFMHYLVHLPRVCGSDMEHTYSVVLGTKLIIVKEYLSLSQMTQCACFALRMERRWIFLSPLHSLYFPSLENYSTKICFVGAIVYKARLTADPMRLLCSQNVEEVDLSLATAQLIFPLPGELQY